MSLRTGRLTGPVYVKVAEPFTLPSPAPATAYRRAPHGPRGMRQLPWFSIETIVLRPRSAPCAAATDLRGKKSTSVATGWGSPDPADRQTCSVQRPTWRETCQLVKVAGSSGSSEDLDPCGEKRSELRIRAGLMGLERTRLKNQETGALHVRRIPHLHHSRIWGSHSSMDENNNNSTGDLQVQGCM